jgi:hypothetical protein
MEQPATSTSIEGASIPQVHERGGARGGAGRYIGSHVPIAAWLNPHLTTGYAAEVSKHLNIQPYGEQMRITRMVASGWTEEAARGGQ